MAKYGKPRKPNVPLGRRVRNAVEAINPVTLAQRTKDIVDEEVDLIKTSYKSADKRTKNLFAGALAISPGFLMTISGLIMVGNNYGVARDCNVPESSKDQTSQVEPAYCKAADDLVEDGGILMLAGTAGMLIPGASFVARDSYLKRLDDKLLSSIDSSQPNSQPPISR